MKDAKKFEIRIDVPSVKKHVALAPSPALLQTSFWPTSGGRVALASSAALNTVRSVGPAALLDKQVR